MWILCLGFTLAFGSMFSKTWRVHSIFTNIRMDKKAIKVRSPFTVTRHSSQDSKLYAMVGVLLLLDIIVLTLWAIISPFTVTKAQLPVFVSFLRLLLSMEFLTTLFSTEEREKVPGHTTGFHC